MKIFPLKKINIIVAMTENRVIGTGNDLPWHIPEDLKLFKRETLGNIVIMGRRTFESIGKPLPGRKNIILTSDPEKIPTDTRKLENVYVFSSFLDAAGAAFSLEGELFVIGGASVYRDVLKYADSLFISKVKNDFKGDVYFPDYNRSSWTLVKSEDFTGFSFEVYERADQSSEYGPC